MGDNFISDGSTPNDVAPELVKRLLLVGRTGSVTDRGTRLKYGRKIELSKATSFIMQIRKEKTKTAQAYALICGKSVSFLTHPHVMEKLRGCCWAT